MRLPATLILVAAVGCANDPQYLPAPMTLEAGQDDGMGGLSQATSSLMLPIKPETMKDATARMALADKLGVMVPYVKVGDIAIEVDWTVTNLDDTPGQFKVELNGANEWFIYDPTVVIPIVPGDDEQPPTPGLQGDIPIDVPANGQVDGLFREDQVLEASIDCDQVTRGNVNPFAATLTVNKNDPSFQPLSTPVLPTAAMPDPPPQTPMGTVIPRAAFASLIRLDLVFKPDHHMQLEYTVRVRDQRGIVDDKGIASPASEIVMFMPAMYTR